MATKWQEKGIGFLSKRGQTNKKPVESEDDGTIAGYHVEHWDGRQDAVVQPKTVRLKVKVEEVEQG